MALAPARAAEAFSDFGYPVITVFGADQIGADPAGYCAVQGPDGMLYVGGNGLLTYDGDRWAMTSVRGIVGVYGLDFGSDGRLWAAAEGEVGWFSRTDSARWQFHSLRPMIGKDEAIHGQVWSILADGNGAVFVTSERVYRWDGTQVRSWPITRHSRTLLRFKGEIWVRDFWRGLYRVGENGVEAVNPSELQATLPGFLLWSDPKGARWLYQTSEGVSLTDRAGARIEFPSGTAKLLQEAMVLHVALLPGDRFAFGCYRSGIIVTDRNGVVEQHLREAEGVPDYVHSLFVDREGLLWSLSHVGIRRLDVNSPTRIFDVRASVPPTIYRDIGSHGAVVMLGTAQGALALDADHRHFSKVDLGTSVHLSASSPDGVLASSQTGIWRYGTGGATLLLPMTKGTQVNMPSALHPGEVLLAVYDSTIVTLNADRTTRTIVQKLPVVGASLAEDGNALWIGTDTQGLFRAELDPTRAVTATRPPRDSGLPDMEGAVYVRRIPLGDIIVLGDAGGWVKPHGRTAFESIRNYPARPFTAVSNALADGSVWLIHGAAGSLASGIALITPQGGWHWTPHSIAGLESIGIPSGISADQDENGHPVLWIGGSKSILRHVVLNGPIAPRPMAPLLWAFTQDGADERHAIAASVPYSTHAIEFELAEPEFAHRGSIHLETRILGIDPGWMPVSKESRRELTAIRDGRYTFQARAIAETGRVSEPTVFTFEVAPPWWRNRLALWIEFGTFAAAVYLGIQWRMRTLRRRNEHLEQKVKERTEELAVASAAKTQFVANMSHDIRNPLNGIVGLTLALEDTPLDSQQRELIATLRECTSYLSSLVDDVLDFASIEAGRVEIRSAPFVPAELLNSVVTTLKAECIARHALVTIETDPEVPPLLQGDAGRIQQILVNYVSNALKYAPGHIRLCAAVAADSPDEVEFSVVDEGAGITPSEQTTLFTKFTRLGSARRSHVPGTGLGLASCRLLADVMGGLVGVDSEVGRGSRFFLRLPLTIATEPILIADDLKLPPTTVLLVEDTDYNALAAKAVLSKLGLTCDRARTGAEAVQLFERKRHHIVLLDRNLPDLDGTEVAKRLRELETDGLHSVVLAVTAYCTAEDRNVCLAAGMDAFLGKPLTPDKLRKALLSAANQIRSTPTLAATTDSPAAAASRSGELDTSLLEYLADGTEGGVSAQAERFIADLNAAFGQLVSVANRGDAPAVLGDAAHRVLGNARMIGAASLIDLLIRCETAGRQDDRATVTGLLPTVQAEIENVTAALRRHPAVQPK